jgi:hypothetical protein
MLSAWRLAGGGLRSHKALQKFPSPLGLGGARGEAIWLRPWGWGGQGAKAFAFALGPGRGEGRSHLASPLGLGRARGEGICLRPWAWRGRPLSLKRPPLCATCLARFWTIPFCCSCDGCASSRFHQHLEYDGVWASTGTSHSE